VRRLAQAANEALDTVSLRERLKSVGVTIIPKERRGPDYLAKFIPSEIKKWEGPMKASGVSIAGNVARYQAAVFTALGLAPIAT
jgi:hypothetical protein